MAHNSGHLQGSYNNVGANSAQSNPIYTIGSSYNPAASTLSNMYGVGYSHGNNASFLSFSGLTTVLISRLYFLAKSKSLWSWAGHPKTAPKP